MTHDIYALGRAMREAQRAYRDCKDGVFDDPVLKFEAQRAAEAAFDEALAEGPVAGGCARDQTSTQYCAEAVEAKAQADVAERNLGNILARIHRDGGQYQAEHGTLKACVDADLIVSNLLAMQDRAEAAEARIAALEGALNEAHVALHVYDCKDSALAAIRAALAKTEEGK